VRRRLDARADLSYVRGMHGLGRCVVGMAMLSLACGGGGSRARAPEESGGRAFTVPFRLRGHAGVVSIAYETNADPARWGFDLIGLPFDARRTIGFPVFDATVRYDARGYRAVMGWIQLVSVRDTKTGEEDTTVDQLPILRDSDTPFSAIGPAASSFDAPGPNPPRADEVWTAFTFLAVCPDIGRTRRVAPLLAVRWGYTLAGGRPSPLPLETVPLTEWDRLVPVLRRRYPSWEFLPHGSIEL
jgi:hypothetical protein